MGKIKKRCKICDKIFLVFKFRIKTARFCSKSCFGKHRTGKRNSCWRGGLPNCQKCGKKLSTRKSRFCNEHKGLGQLGKNNWAWKGGKSKNQHNIKSPKYKRWVNKVFERDSYTCQDCGERGIYLQAHHIKSWANYPKLRFTVANGLTLCEICHEKTDNYKGKNKNGE
mgnify:CR=1 FL=1